MRKKRALIGIVTFLLIFPVQLSAESEFHCPSTKSLLDTKKDNQDELNEALNHIVPDTYGENDYGNYFSKWEVTSAQPFTEAVEKNQQNEEYYNQAKQACGEDVAEQSWLVKLHFPLWEGKSENAEDGQLFLAKSKEDGWFAWYRVQ
ncbi:hypothetical protein GWK91_02040 [Virgibacillus sp. MSP4-1]|uniref:hypothetical protein n=1 Tax=Virgibacillus sp. MSP4-1 TaxID=2700081 RepID=UPI00039FD0AD|nr:hypothetical protein [Virgibacillus sp. MSP4-1]QHS21798.1 hypothetical protein GWK91_02040 [Virgibacillus sp. MSP4-1]